ncbi:hypothetical protein GCM10010260_59410 [Streptomyces filipinensis]|uniref:Insertion element IS402-like domain-containing protein n=1 Tax=Streptomyces filipinensis TaxID=66887 RepID=A0A918IFZ8_9ACTN|nr:hypothetical protein GCM10010260_59410 [Streptomyces filipinensis]
MSTGRAIDAIACQYRTGTSRIELPDHFGSWKRAHNRLRRWTLDGTWEKVFIWPWTDCLRLAGRDP